MLGHRYYIYGLRETVNQHNPFAVFVLKDGIIVECLKTLAKCYLFQERHSLF